MGKRETLPGRKASIVLVHGTWGRWSSWHRRAGLMRRGLTERFAEADVESFVWSGRNTHRARIEGALALADRLDELADRHVVLVAHSHGGNVALGAARLARATRNQRLLVTLATPFLAPGRPVGQLPSVVVTVALGSLVLAILGFVGVVPVLLPWLLATLLVAHLGAHLYSLAHRRWMRSDAMRSEAFDAMTGLREAVFLVDDDDRSRRLVGARRTPRVVSGSIHPAPPPLPIEVIGVPMDEAGLGLAAGQFLGVLSAAAARMVNGVTQLAGLGVAAGVVYVVVGLFYLVVVAVLAVPVLAFIAEGDVGEAIARLGQIRDIDALAALIDDVLPGVREQVPGWLAPVGRHALTALRVALTVLIVVVVTLAALLTMLVLESLAVGYDGASLLSSTPVTTSSFPVGRSRVTLVPTITMSDGRLAHGWLTSSRQGVDEVARAVERALGEPAAPYS